MPIESYFYLPGVPINESNSYYVGKYVGKIL